MHAISIQSHAPATPAASRSRTRSIPGGVAGTTLESVTNEFGLKRVRVFTGCGRQVRLLPAAWTDLRAVDAYEAQAAGRSPFRADDLSDLRELVDELIRKDCP